MNEPSIKEIRSKYQDSSGDVWYARTVCRKFSPYFSWLLVRTPIIPNQVTILMILMGVIGGIFLGMPGYFNGLIGVLFLQLFLIFDCVDGEIARCKKIFSLKGKFLDFLANDIVLVSIFSGLAFRIFSNNYKISDSSLFQNPLTIILGISATVFFLLSKLSFYYVGEIDERLGGSSLKSNIFNNRTKLAILKIVKNLSYPPTIILIVTIGATFNLFHYILFFYGIFFPFYYFASLAVRLKNKEVR